MSSRRKENPRGQLIGLIFAVLVVVLGIGILRFGWGKSLMQAYVNWSMDSGKQLTQQQQPQSK